MSKERVVNTRFWADDYIMNLDPLEKFLFIYLLTNDKTNICGIYEIHPRIMAAETGIDKEMIIKMLARFERDEKVKTEGSWVAIGNFIKYQHVSNPKIRAGILDTLSHCPNNLKQWVYDRLSISYPYLIDRLSHLNTNTNTNTNTNLNIKGVVGGSKKNTVSDSPVSETFVDSDKSTLQKIKDEQREIIRNEMNEDLKKQSQPDFEKPEPEKQKGSKREGTFEIAPKIFLKPVEFKNLSSKLGGVDYLIAIIQNLSDQKSNYPKGKTNECIDDNRLIHNFINRGYLNGLLDMVKRKKYFCDMQLNLDSVFDKHPELKKQSQEAIALFSKSTSPSLSPSAPAKVLNVPPFNLPSVIVAHCDACERDFQLTADSQMRWDNDKKAYRCHTCGSFQSESFPEKIYREESKKCEQLLASR